MGGRRGREEEDRSDPEEASRPCTGHPTPKNHLSFLNRTSLPSYRAVVVGIMLVQAARGQEEAPVVRCRPMPFVAPALFLLLTCAQGEAKDVSDFLLPRACPRLYMPPSILLRQKTRLPPRAPPSLPPSLPRQNLPRRLTRTGSLPFRVILRLADPSTDSTPSVPVAGTREDAPTKHQYTRHIAH